VRQRRHIICLTGQLRSPTSTRISGSSGQGRRTTRARGLRAQHRRQPVLGRRTTTSANAGTIGLDRSGRTKPDQPCTLAAQLRRTQPGPPPRPHRTPPRLWWIWPGSPSGWSRSRWTPASTPNSRRHTTRCSGSRAPMAPEVAAGDPVTDAADPWSRRAQRGQHMAGHRAAACTRARPARSGRLAWSPRTRQAASLALARRVAAVGPAVTRCGVTLSRCSAAVVGGARPRRRPVVGR
jgi:hypothetical protein